MKTSYKKKNSTSPTITNIIKKMKILINLNPQKNTTKNNNKNNKQNRRLTPQHIIMSQSTPQPSHIQTHSSKKRQTKTIQITPLQRPPNKISQKNIIIKNPKKPTKKQNLSTQKNNKTKLKTLNYKTIMITPQRLITKILHPYKKNKQQKNQIQQNKKQQTRLKKHYQTHKKTQQTKTQKKRINRTSHQMNIMKNHETPNSKYN